MEITFEKREQLKAKPDQHELGFGRYMTDYMFLIDWEHERGWHDARIVPYAPLSIDPACNVLHYALETFEGLKAYRGADGTIRLFRPERNARRMNRSNERLCMPDIPEELFLEAVKAMVRLEQDWVPSEPGTSLYIRPFTYATEVGLGVHKADSFQFAIICSPVGAYYPQGMSPIKIMVEDELVRAVRGGTGFAKCGGNYAASVFSQVKAEEQGYTQVLWLDGVERKYIQEVGSMNMFFKIQGELYTAPLDGSVLPGVTRDSVIHILKEWGYPVHEANLAIQDVMRMGHLGYLEESFGTGTAAVISPVGELAYQKDIITINEFQTGSLTQKLYDALTGIQWGRIEDKYGWTLAL